MKFHDGYWRVRDGVTQHTAAEVVDVATGEGWASFAALTRPRTDRGAHLNTPTVTVELRSPAPEVVAVTVRHHLPRGPQHPAFEVRAEDGWQGEVVHGDGWTGLAAGGLEARVATEGPWSLELRAGGRTLLHAGARSTGFAQVEGDGTHVLQRLTLPVGANVYGFGERFTPFVKNGQVVETWNEDGGTASEQAYKSVPLLVSDAGFGVFVDHPGRVAFEVCSEVVSDVQLSVPGEEVTYLVVHGTPAEVVERHTALTGRPALPPRWSFGLWLSTSFTTDYDEATVTGFLDGMAERGLPLSVFHFDCYWMRPLHWCDFVWDPATFPDPEGLLARLHERGLRTCVWINPYLGQRSATFDEAVEAGHLVRRPDGSTWQWDRWVAGMGLVDFTSPAAREWYAEKVRGLLRQGVDALKTDFGERIPTDVVWADGADPQRMHNHYAQQYNQTVFEAVEAERGQGEAVLFARAATAGGQRFPVHWGGDSEATWSSMAETLRGGLSLGLAGFGFWSHDIGGFEQRPDPELFVRWVQFGLLSSHARLHGSTSYRVPWEFGDEAVEVTRSFLRLRHRLLPYLWDAAAAAHQRGLPVLRAMVLAFPDDPTCAPLDRQYMLGPDLLVAPVLTAGGEVTFYLPSGTWTHLLDGSTLDGPGWHTRRFPLDQLPLYVRPGAVLPLGSRTDGIDDDDLADPTFEVHGLADGATGRATLRDAAGAPQVVLDVHRDGEELVGALVTGADLVRGGWTLRWATGPLDGHRGPSVSTDAGTAEARLDVGA